MDYTNKALGLRVQTQIPLNVKEYVESEEVLKDLGIGNNLAFVYEKGLIVYCILEGTRWEWREVQSGEENTGLLDTDFIYPDNIITFGIDYSNKSYNFFTTIIEIDGSETKINAGTNVTKTGIGTILNPYVINASDTTYTAGVGLNLTDTVFSLNNLQKKITYPADFTGTNYTILTADNNYSIIIDNGATAVTITVPTGLMVKIQVGFIQKGTGLVTFVESGTTLKYLTGLGLKMAGINANAYLEKEGSIEELFLFGNIKA